MYIWRLKKNKSTFIILDELHSPLYPNFEEYKNISKIQNGSKKENLFQRAILLWSLLLQIIKTPGIFMCSTTKNIIFNFLGNEELIKENDIKIGQNSQRDISSSCFYDIKFNPLEDHHVEKTNSLSLIRKSGKISIFQNLRNLLKI